MSLKSRPIAGLLPHAGAMVLLDRVRDWDGRRASCETNAHHRLDNPLRRDGMLPAWAGIEFAAQAMGVHVALTNGTALKGGVLGSLRDVELHVQRLDDVSGPLVVTVELLNSSAKASTYSFELSGEGGILLAGRAGVFYS